MDNNLKFKVGKHHWRVKDDFGIFCFFISSCFRKINDESDTLYPYIDIYYDDTGEARKTVIIDDGKKDVSKIYADRQDAINESIRLLSNEKGDL